MTDKDKDDPTHQQSNHGSDTKNDSTRYNMGDDEDVVAMFKVMSLFQLISESSYYLYQDCSVREAFREFLWSIDTRGLNLLLGLNLL